MDKTMLYTTATTLPSVAVKMPEMMPPMTTIIMNRHGMAWKNTFTFSEPV